MCWTITTKILHWYDSGYPNIQSTLVQRWRYFLQSTYFLSIHYHKIYEIHTISFTIAVKEPSFRISRSWSNVAGRNFNTLCSFWNCWSMLYTGPVGSYWRCLHRTEEGKRFNCFKGMFCFVDLFRIELGRCCTDIKSTFPFWNVDP